MATENDNEADRNEREKRDPSDPSSGPNQSGDSFKLASLSDQELVAACLIRDDKDSAAFVELVRRCFDDVLTAARRALAKGPRPVACDENDLVQIFFARLDKNKIAILGKFLQSEGQLSHYLAQVAYRHSMKQLQKPCVNWPGHCHNAEPAELEAVAARRPAPNWEQVVDRVLGTLSSTTRSVVHAKFGLGPFTLPHPVKEIARIHHMSERSVHRKLAMVLKHRLHKLLDSFDDDLE